MLFRTFKKILWWLFNILKVCINLIWNPGWIILIWRKWKINFDMWLGIWIWLIYLADLYHQRTNRRNRWIFFVVFLIGNMRDYGNMFSGGCWYSTMNDTLMINFFGFICFKKKAFVQFYYTNIVDVRYILNVDHMISVVFHNNHWWPQLCSRLFSHRSMINSL